MYKANKYEEAAARLKAAYRLVPSAALLYNTAKCYEQLGDYASAVDYYQRYLKSSVGASDAELVRDLIKHYRQKIGKKGVPRTPEERAKAIATKGREYYRAGRFADAIAQLQHAHRVTPKSAFIYNIAKCYEKMGEYDQAIVYYKRYLGMEPQAADRQDVISIVVSLEARMRQTLSELTVRTAPSGADIYIDDMSKLLGQTPLEIRLSPGEHKIVIQKNGFESVERVFQMPDDRPSDLAYALEKVKNFGGMTVESNVNGAQIFLDGKILALTPYNTTKLVTQGTHQVTVQRDGYYLYQADVTIQKGKLTTIKADLPERGELTGWMTTLGTWVAGVSLVAGVTTAGTAFFLGDQTVRDTPISDGLWTTQIVGMYGGLAGVLVGAGLIGLDLLIQPSDVYELKQPSDELPLEIVSSGDEGGEVVSPIESIQTEGGAS